MKSIEQTIPHNRAEKLSPLAFVAIVYFFQHGDLNEKQLQRTLECQDCWEKYQ